MLQLISTKKPRELLTLRALSELNINVMECDEKVIHSLKSACSPNFDNVDLLAHNIVEYIGRKIVKQSEDKIIRQKEISEHEAWLATLSEEEKEAMISEAPEKLTPILPLEDYIGVLIGNDIPNWLVVQLVTYFRRINVDIYFIMETEITKVSEYVKTEIRGILETKYEPTGEVLQRVFRLYGHHTDVIMDNI